MNCTGTETRLVDCPSNPLGVHDCSHFEDAGVTCQGICRQIGLNSHIVYNLLAKPELSMHHIHAGGVGQAHVHSAADDVMLSESI